MNMRRALVLMLLTPACGGMAATPATCNTPCVGETVCAAGACQPAFPAKYRVVPEASLSAKSPGGSCWDEPFCGDPDLLVTLSVDGRVLGQTSEQGGTFTYEWTDEPIVATLDKGGMLELIAYDVDVDTNDVAARCSAMVTIELVRSGVIHCSAAAGMSTVGATIVRDTTAQ